MNLEQMAYIKEVLETKSITLAAQNLHVSQSAISQSISLFEKEIGIQLFKRSRFGTVPTEEGKNIIRKSLEILKKVEEIKEEVQAVSSSFSGELKIATIPALFMNLIPKILARFKKDFPQINITIIEMESKDILEKVAKHDMDLGLITLRNETDVKLMEQIKFQSFYYESIIQIIVHKDSPLAYHKEVHLQEILDYPLVMYANSYWANFTEQIKKKYGPVNIMFTTTNTEVIKRTVSEGLGISLLTSLMLKDDPYIENGRIVPIYLADYQFDQFSKYGWIHAKNHPHLRLIKKFLEYVEIKL